jgi:thiol-disulfide isomerase/thioredoxin
MIDEETHLIEFYGEECPPCKQIKMFLNRLESEEGITVKRYEVWHNSQNQNLMMKYSKGRCNGVPFMYNKKNDRFICGAPTYDQIVEWAKSE